MTFLRSTLDRLVPALLIAAGVMLVLSGLFALDAAPADAAGLSSSASEAAVTSADPGSPLAVTSADPGSPLGSPGPTGPLSTDVAPIVATLPPTPMPPRTARPSPAAASATAGATAPSGGPAVASRITIPSLSIDLPVVSGDLEVRGNRNAYPLCDVAQFLTDDAFTQPSRAGTTYIYAHARAGMFLPLLTASQRRDGASMLGSLVQVYTSDGRLWLYEVFQVKRHATDFTLAFDVPEGEQRLVLQTSEGPSGHVPKLQVAARLIGSQPVSTAAANPKPEPRAC
jgi:hypothetical protein